MRFHQIKFAKEGTKTQRAETAYYECPYCQGHITDADKQKMLRQGKWMGEEEPEGVKPSRKKTGFAINAIYSLGYRYRM